jgi:hypothetical protein
VIHWTDALSKCDLLMARQEIIEFHETIEREADQKGARAYVTQEYASAWGKFYDAPTIENALAFLVVAPALASHFEACSPGGQFFEIDRVLRPIDPGAA